MTTSPVHATTRPGHPPRRRPRSAHAVAALLLALVVALAIALPPPTAQAQAPDEPGLATPEVAAAAFMADELAANGNALPPPGGGPGAVDVGLTADAVLALAAVGMADDVAADATAVIANRVDDYVVDPATGAADADRSAKVLLVAHARGLDWTDFGGRDLGADVRGGMGADGAIGGNTYAHTIGVMALAVVVDDVPEATDDLALATRYLLEQQCPDGGIPVFGTACTGDADATALGVHALLAAGQDDAAQAAADWLVANQDDGVQDSPFGPNANSNGLAAWGLRGAGRPVAADAAADWVAARQLPCAVPATDRGAIAYDDGALDDSVPGGIDGIARDQFRRTSVQAMLAFGSTGYHELDASEAAAGTPSPCWDPGVCPDGAGVTSVVEPRVLTGDAPSARCVDAVAGMDGLDLLAAAGHETTTAEFSFGTALCTIDGLPVDIRDSCFGSDTHPNGYWSYWVADRSSTAWGFSPVGAVDSTPVAGDLEAFAWDAGDGSYDTTPIVRLPAQRVAATRLAGDKRADTAIRISQRAVDDGAAGAVVLTRSDDFADALSGVPLAADVDGPLLVTDRTGLLDPVLAEIRRVLPAGGTVHVLGGTNALRPAVADRLAAAGFTVDRLAGRTRYETSVRIAGVLGDPELQLVTTGENFPDALAAGAVAADRGGVVLLSKGRRTVAVVDDYLDANDGEVVAIGGPAARAYPAADSVVGRNRTETATMVAQRWFRDAPVSTLARDDDFPDAMAGGVLAGGLHAPLLLTDTDDLPDATADVLCTVGFHTREVVVFGGASAVTDEVAEAARQRLEGQGC